MGLFVAVKQVAGSAPDGTIGQVMKRGDRSPTGALAGWRVWLLPVAVLLGGVLAWLLAGAVVLSIVEDDDPDAPAEVATLLPTALALEPTLAAHTHTPAPTITPTMTPSGTPSVMPTATVKLTPEPSATPLPSPAPTQTALPLTAPSPTPRDLAQQTPTVPRDAAIAGEAIPTGAMELAAAAGCVPPEGWEPYTVQQDDTLFAFQLGAENAVTVDELVAANCLDSRYLRVGQQIYLPPGAADNAPPSNPAAAAGPSGSRGPRTPNCPCTIVIPAGWRMEQVAGAIDAAQTLFTGQDFLDVVGPGAQTPFDFTHERPPGTSLEGFLYPGTYTVQNDTTADQFRDMLLEAFAANIALNVRADAAAKGVTFYQALIIASIVQRESRAPETQKLVASIFYNRLRDGNRLASTVPVSYALGGPGNWWPRVTGSNMEVDSPYNTYTRPGLPPTPINSPDANAILGTVYAAETDYYYMAGGCGRGAMFARTYEEHLANIRCE